VFITKLAAPDANSSIPLLHCFLFGDHLSKLRALVFEGIRLHLKHLCIYYKRCSGQEGHGFNQHDAAGLTKQEERASHALSSLSPGDGAFVKTRCLLVLQVLLAEEQRMAVTGVMSFSQLGVDGKQAGGQLGVQGKRDQDLNVKD